VVTKTVLITGGLGCLGGRLSKYLMDVSYQVVIGSSRKNAKLPKELANCSLVYTDFDDIDTLNYACSGVNCVIHLATVNSQQSHDDLKLAMKVNGIGTHNLIQASITSKVEYFLYFSTAHIYGSPLVGEIDEDTLPKPIHYYAITHRLAEDFLLESISSQNINGSVIRLSNSIGLPLIKEANCWMLFVNDVCKQAVVNRHIVIHSNPNIERDFIPMSSVCEITEYFLSNHMTADYPIFNVGSGLSHTLLETAEMIANRCEKVFGYCPKIIFSKDNTTKNLNLEYKVNKLTSGMGYVTNDNLMDSIDEVLKFCNAEFS
jgi:UDP-glucose 4-epimerase